MPNRARFGTGYSSFEYLRWLPLTALKADRVFIRDPGADSVGGSICVRSTAVRSDFPERA